MSKKGIAVDPHSVVSDCRLMDLRDGRGAPGKILRFYPDAIRVFTNLKIKPGAILRVMIYDEVDFNMITLFVRIGAPNFCIREWLSFFERRRLRKSIHFYGTSMPREYYGRMYNLKALPTEYSALIDRMRKAVRRSNRSVDPKPVYSSKKIEFKIAETATEKEAAWRLAYVAAVRQTGAPYSDKQLLISNHLLLASTTTIVGIQSGEVVMTLTCTGDTAFGLPIEEAHIAAVARLRAASTGLVEFGMFGMREEAFGGFGPLAARRRSLALKDIFKFAVRHAVVARGATHAIAASGAFDKIIQMNLGFVELHPSSYRSWDALQKAVVLDLKKAVAGFAAGKIDERRLTASNVFTMRDLYYLFVEQSNLASRLSPEERELLARLHPHLNEWFTSLPTLLLYT